MGKTLTKVIGITAGAVAAWAVAIKPRTKGKPDMTVFSAYDYANGGIHDFCRGLPDNTLPAYDKAMKHGYGVVMDVRITRDGTPVVFTDNNLWRLASIEGSVEEKSYDEIKEITLVDTDSKIPTLKEALDLIDGQIPVVLNLKSVNNNSVELCEACAVITDQYEGIVAVESIDYRCVSWFRRYRPAIIRGQMFEKTVDFGNSLFTFMKMLANNMLLTNYFSRPDFISTHMVDRKSISLRFCRFLYHVPVMNWNVSTMKQYEAARMDDAIVAFEDIEP